LNDEDVIFVAGDWRVARGEFLDRAGRAAAVLRGAGVGAGDCVGVALRNRPQFFEVLTASGALGAKIVPVAWRLKREEVRYLVEDSGAKLVVYDTDLADQMDGLPGLSLQAYEAALRSAPREDLPMGALPQLELYSSGTTGRPKAIERIMPKAADGKPPDIRSLGFLERMGVGGPGETHLMCGPLYHSQPIGFSTQALASGHSVVMMDAGFDAETCLATIAREKVTWLTCVPTHFVRILALPEAVRRRYDLSSVKAVLHSAAPCPADVKRQILQLFPPNTVWEIYGGTEGAMTIISPEEWLRKPGSVGRPFTPGVELRVLDPDGAVLPPGEVGLIYSQTALGFRYKGSDALNAETWRGDFFTLGDMGYVDEDGYLFVTDRLKDMIITGGANVYPAEVEAVLFSHPAVGDATVIGVPDPHWGEAVKAIVEPRAETTAKDIIDFCRERLAHYKCPTTVDFVARLPRDPNGKVRKREVREPYWANAGRGI
jgi:long-chain acyl-CoA synthetase